MLMCLASNGINKSSHRIQTTVGFLGAIKTSLLCGANPMPNVRLERLLLFLPSVVKQ